MHSLEIFKFCPRCGSDKFIESSINSKRCQNCGFEYYKPVSAATIALIFDDKGSLLVTRREKNPAKGTLGLPGGFVDFEETIEEGVIREVKEETNMDVIVEKYLFCVPNTYVYSGFEVKTLDFVLRCSTLNSVDMKAEKSEISDLAFIPVADLNVDDFGLTSIKEVIKKVKNNTYM